MSTTADAAAVRVLVVDDHPLYREGVAAALSRQAGVRIVGQAVDSPTARAVAAAMQPDVVLLDLSIPGGGGLPCLELLLSDNPNVKVIVLTVSEDPDDVSAALHGGARGYVVKGVGSLELREAIRLVADGQTYVSPTLASSVIRGLEPSAHDEPSVSLSPRELEIVRLLAAGLTNREIGAQLYVAEKTVKHHVTQILQKLNVRNRLEAALLALQLGYVGDQDEAS